MKTHKMDGNNNPFSTCYDKMMYRLNFNWIYKGQTVGTNTKLTHGSGSMVIEKSRWYLQFLDTKGLKNPKSTNTSKYIHYTYVGKWE